MRKGRFSKTLIICIIVMNIIFTIAVLYVVVKSGVEPSTLIASWFGWTTGELWMLTSIKKKKVEKGEFECSNKLENMHL